MIAKSQTISFLNERISILKKMIREANGEEEDMDEVGENINGAEDEPTPDNDSEPAEGEEENNVPEEQAEPETGVFMSANQKAVVAKSALDALLLQPPPPGTIPPELLNVNDSNADQVLAFVQKYVQTSSSTDIGNENDPESLVSKLKNS